MENNSFIIKLQAMLDKPKSLLNIKSDIKSIEPKLKIKIQGTLDKTATKKEFNSSLKSIKPKIKVDADTSQAMKKIKKLGQQKTKTTVQATIDSSQVTSSLKATQKEAKGLLDRFMNGVVGVNLMRMGIQKVTQAIHEAIAGLKELDKIKTNIQMVSATSDSGVNAMMQSYNNMAKQLSTTTKSVSEAANEFLRMGESVSSTNELIKSSQVLSKVGMIESSDAASYLISSLKGYQLAADDSIRVIDKLTSVDLEAAVSAGGLAEALSRCSNIANNSGTSMDRLIGYMATTGEVTQESMSVIGNAFKSIYSRMNNIKIGKFVDDETGESLSDTEKVLTKLGIRLRDTEDTYRDFDDVLDDIGGRWKSLTQVEQNAVSVAMAGTMQRERFSALMNNYSNALKYSETAANSAGSALERYGVYQDSVEAKTNELTAAIESLSMNTMSEGLLSGIVEATTGLVEFIDKFGILKGTLAGFVTMGISKMFVSMATGIVSAAKSTAQLTVAMAMLRNGRDTQNLLNIGKACVGLSDNQLKLILSTKNLEYADRLLILQGMGVAEAEREQTLATLGFANAENTATISTFSLKGALSGLWTLIKANPIGALVTVVSLATMAFSWYKQKQEELIRTTQESANTYKETASSIKDYTTRYKELQEALTAAKGNEEETYNVKKQLLDLQNELNEKFADEYGAVNLVTDAYKDQTAAIQSLNKEAAQTFLNENMKGIRKAEEQMQKERHYVLSYSEHLGTEKGDAIKEIAEKYKDSGIYLYDEIGDGSYAQFSVNIKADAQSAYETVNAFENDLRDKAKELGDEDLFNGTLNISSSVISDAKEVTEEYGDIFKQALSAEIASDDDKAKKYNEALEAVSAYNEAVLQSEDIYNDGNVEKARQSLQDIKDELTSSEEWEKYGALIEDVFDQADTSLLDFNEQLGNDDSLKKLAEDLKGLDDIDLRALDENVGENASFDKLKESAESYGLSVEELIDALVRLGYVQTQVTEEVGEKLSFKDKFKNLWDSAAFKDAKEDLAKLAKEAGITEKDIQSLAGENAELASLLNESGMSAQFAATCFNKVCNGADGFSAITNDALAIDQALHGMDESLQSVAASKSAYDKALEQDDYDSEFKNYQEAYKNAMQMFEDGDYGRHFRSSMEYFLGEDSYAMSIEELYAAMNNLKSVFGEDATNGLEFLDKLYAKKDVLDGMDSSLRKLSDGSYDFDLKPEEFEKIGEALGMTADEVAACTNALGMFGNFRSYDLDEVEETLSGISIAAKNGEQSILSMQGVEKILTDIGYSGYEIYHIMQDIQDMGSIQLIDFSGESEESIQSAIDKLRELEAFEIGETSIDASGLITAMQETLGMAEEDIDAFLEKINGKFQFKDAEGSLITLEQAKGMVLRSEDTSAAEGIDKIGESADAADVKIQALHEDMEKANQFSMENLASQFGNVSMKAEDLGRKVGSVSRQIDDLNGKSITIPMIANGAGQNNGSGNVAPKGGKDAYAKGTVGNAYAKGYDGLPANEKGALRSEYGQKELTVYPNGTYEVTSSPIMSDLPKGTVIFNERQTEQILKQSSHGRGSAYAEGTAGGKNPATGKSYRKSAKSEKKSSEEKSKKEEKEFEKVIDWIENRIEKFKRKFDKWIKQAETAVTSGFITKYYKKATNAIKKELSTYGKAYNRYMKEANAVGLDEKYAKKVRNGTIDIETIRAKGSEEDVKKHEELADKVQKYQEYYNKAVESTTSFVETAEELYNLPLDKAATKIEKFKDAIDLLDKKLDNAIGAKKKNRLIDKQTKEERKTLKAEKTAKKESAKNLKSAKKNMTSLGALNSSDVSAKEKKKIKKAVKNGKEINLSFFKEGSKAYNAAVKYNEALKANEQATYDCAIAQQEYNAWLVEASKIKFDNIADDYEKRVQLLGYEMDAIDNRISEIEAAGKKADKSYYESQMAINGQTLAQLQSEKAALEENIQNIKAGTDEWHDAYDQIQQVSSSISDCVKETYELNNAINQLHFDLFDNVSDSIGRIITEQEFLQGLFAHEKTTDDKTGDFTEAGLAKLGSLSASYYAAKNNAERDAAEVRELQRMLDSGTLHSGILGVTFNSVDDLQAKLEEMYSKWQGDIKETYGLEEKLAEMMKDKYQAELDLLKDLIDARKEALNAEKDLHDYQRALSEKTKSISAIQKQIAAYSGDTSQEGMARLQRLQKELADKQDDLKETEYDRYISDQQDMLDKLYQEYEELLTKKLDDFMTLVREGLGIANDNTAAISDYLSRVASENGYTEETKGLFSGVTSGIRESVDAVIAKMSELEASRSGTAPQGQQPESAAPAPPQEAPQPANGALVNAVEHKNKQPVNEAAHKKPSSQATLPTLDEMSHAMPQNAEETQKRKSARFPGYKKGGVISVEDIEDQVRKNGDDGIASVKNGEGVLSEEQMDVIRQCLKKGVTPEGKIEYFADPNQRLSFTALPLPIAMPQPIPNAKAAGNVVNIDSITLPNVKDYETFKSDMFRDMQTNRKFEGMINDMGMQKLSGNGTLNKRGCKF